MPIMPNPGVIAVTLPRNYRKFVFETVLSVEDIRKLKEARRRAARAAERQARADEASAVKEKLRALVATKTAESATHQELEEI
jgi:hypothetical protein